MLHGRALFSLFHSPILPSLFSTITGHDFCMSHNISGCSLKNSIHSQCKWSRSSVFAKEQRQYNRKLKALWGSVDTYYALTEIGLEIGNCETKLEGSQRAHIPLLTFFLLQYKTRLLRTMSWNQMCKKDWSCKFITQLYCRYHLLLDPYICGCWKYIKMVYISGIILTVHLW